MTSSRSHPNCLPSTDTMSDLHLDFSELTFLDSAALSGLLTLHGRTSEARVALHLDHRPQFLDRVLQVTGLFDHFDLTRSDAEIGDPGLLRQAVRANQALAEPHACGSLGP